MPKSMDFYEWIERLKTATGNETVDLIEMLQLDKVTNIPTPALHADKPTSSGGN